MPLHGSSSLLGAEASIVTTKPPDARMAGGKETPKTLGSQKRLQIGPRPGWDLPFLGQGIVVVQTRHLMVSYDPRRATPALEQLPSLLAPAGFETRFAANGEEAEVLLDSWTVHVAVVDWADSSPW